MRTYSKVLGVAVAAAMVLPSAGLARDKGRGNNGYGYGNGHHNGRHGNNGGGAAVAILGLAIVGIAAAAASKRDKQDDRRNWGNAYSPQPDITCYPDQRQCYWRDQFSPDWTDSQFGYDQYNRGGY